MKFTITRNQLFKALQRINSLLIKQHTASILENVLLTVNYEILCLTAINLDIEIIIYVPITKTYQIGSTTVSGKKLLNICRHLSNDIVIMIQFYNNNLTIITVNSFFSLTSLPIKYFPNLCNFRSKIEFKISHCKFKNMLNLIYFSMAHQDMRYYLNGMLFEINDNSISAVATDGYRIAIYNMPINISVSSCSVIIPRKTILELIRLLDDSKVLLSILIGTNSIRIHMGKTIVTSKLIEGSFPDYRLILLYDTIKMIEVNIKLLKEALLRVAILSNEKFHAVHFFLNNHQLEISANNKKEKAKEIIDLQYSSNKKIEIDINVNYILDVLNVLNHETIIFFIDKTFSKIQLKTQDDSFVSYIIMSLQL